MNLQVAVVTGGHHFEVAPFTRLWRSLEGIDAYTQHMDEFLGSPEAVRDGYNAVVFYTMVRDGPPEVASRGFPGNPRQALERLIGGRQGLVLLHHSLLAYPDWPVWDDLVGLTNRRTLAYDHHALIPVHVELGGHPVTEGVNDWQLHDETYVLPPALPNGLPLLTTTLPTSMPVLAWARESAGRRVVCWQSGHDAHAFEDGSFRTILRQAVDWVAAKPARTEARSS